MLLVTTGLSFDAGLLVLLDLWHAFFCHLLVLVDQPTAEDNAEDSYEEAESCGDPHALPVVWRFGAGEDVGTCTEISIL